MTFLQLQKATSGLSRREQFSLAAILALVGALTAFDVYEDSLEGASLSHMLIEVCIVLLTVGVASFLVIRMLGEKKELIEAARAEISSVREAANGWKSRADSLSKGITDAITEQFKEWELTPAQQEVSFLLLKGLSIQEIATVRETTERTVRQQAHEIYKKSGLSGRAQLSAFFLEDLFERSLD